MENMIIAMSVYNYLKELTISNGKINKSTSLYLRTVNDYEKCRELLQNFCIFLSSHRHECEWKEKK